MAHCKALLTALLILLFCFSAFSQPAEKKIIGYFTSWSVYGRDYHVPDIPAEHISHINYAFANISNGAGTIILGDPYADIDKWYPGDSWDPDSLRGCFHQLQILKGNHPHVKTLISVGGWTWSAYFSNIALTEQSRHTFAHSCMEFITEYTFDGVDIDWEYPVSGGLSTNIYRPEDRENFTLLLAELRDQLDSLETAHGREYLLTIAAPANPDITDNIEVDLIHQYLDWVNIMTFDFHGPWMGTLDPVTNFNSALHVAPDDPLPEPYHSAFNLEAAVDEYIARGTPVEKVHPGLAFYGRGFGSVENINNGLFADYNGPCWQGTWETGVFDYWDIAENYEDINGYTSYWHDDAKVPWLFNPTQNVMISYDNPQSMTEKGLFINDRDLPGAMFWEFSGDRDGVLLSTIFNVLGGGFQPPVVELTLTPQNPPLQIPASGGSFEFNINAQNTTSEPQTIDFRTEIVLPNANVIEILNIQDVTIAPGQTIDRLRNQYVPPHAPAGDYEYSGYIADYQTGEIIDFDSFIFSKDGQIESFTGGQWLCEGEDFTGSAESIVLCPSNISLIEIYPNPFNNTANISIELADPAYVSIKIYNLLGCEVENLYSGNVNRGRNTFVWNADGVSSGVYYLSLQSSGGVRQMRKMVLMK